MADIKKQSFRGRIINEMSVDYAGSLEKNFELAKKLIRITTDGKVDIPNKNSYTGKDQVLLYLIGKLYAKEAELSDTEFVGNQELMDELGVPKGSVLPWLKELRDERKIKRIAEGKNTYHTIPIHLIEKVLNEIYNRRKS